MSTITADDIIATAKELASLGHPIRLQILWWLGQGERSSTDLCGLIGKRQQTISQHLTILKLRRLVAFHRRGKFNFYTLTDDGRAALGRSGVHAA